MKLVKEIMIQDPIVLKEGSNVEDAALLFGEKKIGCLPIVDAQNRLVSFISAGDLIHYIVSNANRMNHDIAPWQREWEYTERFADIVEMSLDHPISNFARNRVVTVSPDTSLTEASRLFNKRSFKHMPVIDNDRKVVGVLNRADLISGMFSQYLHHKDKDTP